MGRLVVVLLLAAGAYLLFRRLGTQGHHRKHSPTIGTPMRRCHYCGTYVPESETLTRGEQTYCSAAHLNAEKSEESP
ncbi:MAG: hypothetical protein J4A00_11055 [Gammaproteobacteria bacterium]|nr:hypothetical protein [Gammaproteobacteria bacterium]